MLNEFIQYKSSGYINLNSSMLSPLTYDNFEFKLNADLIRFLDKYINEIIIIIKKNLDSNRIIDLIIRLHEKEIKYNNLLMIQTNNYNEQINYLDKEKDKEY